MHMRAFHQIWTPLPCAARLCYRAARMVSFGWISYFVLQFLHTVLTWPVAVVIIAVVLRQSLGRLIEHINFNLKSAAGEVTVSSQQQAVTPEKIDSGSTLDAAPSEPKPAATAMVAAGTTPVEDSPAVKELVAQLGSTPLMEELIASIHRDLDSKSK